MKPVVTALVLTVIGAAFVIISAILRISHVVDRSTGYYLLGIGLALGIIGNVLRRKAAKQGKE